MKAPAGLHLRQDLICGAGPWMWREADYWAWEHPKQGYAGIRDLLLAHTKERKVIVQAGGCMGMYPRLWSDHFETVYTFEPDPVNFYCLVANCPSERIVKMQAALSSVAGLATLGDAPDFNAGLFKLDTAQSGTTLVLRLDDLKLPRIDALQLDCEGHEQQIIQGARAAIISHHPAICVEAPNAELRTELNALGYVEAGRNATGRILDVVFVHSV